MKNSADKDYLKKSIESDPWAAMQKFSEKIMSFDSDIFEATYRLFIQKNYMRLKESYLFKVYDESVIFHFVDLFNDSQDVREAAVYNLVDSIKKTEWPQEKKDDIFLDLHYFLSSWEYKYYIYLNKRMIDSGKYREMLKEMVSYRTQYLVDDLDWLFECLKKSILNHKSRMKNYTENVVAAKSLINRLKEAKEKDYV